MGVNRLEQRTTLKMVQDILTLCEKNGTGWSNTVCLLWLPQRRPVPRVPKDTHTHTEKYKYTHTQKYKYRYKYRRELSLHGHFGSHKHYYTNVSVDAKGPH